MNEFENANNFGGENQGNETKDKPVVSESDASSSDATEVSQQTDAFDNAATAVADSAEKKSDSEQETAQVQQQQAEQLENIVTETANVENNAEQPVQQPSFVYQQQQTPPYNPTPQYTQQPYAQQNPYHNFAYQSQGAQQQSYAYPQGQQTNTPKKKSKGKSAFLAIACILIVIAVGIFAVTGFSDTPSSPSKNALSDVPHVSAVSSAEAEEEGLSAAEVYQKVFKSSVSILAYQQATGDLGVLGSGVICQEDTQNKYTYIVTCAHVINDSDYNLKVELWNGTVYTAEVINYDDSNDIGVIRIPVTGLQIAEFGESDEIQPGATVYAIGSPYSSKFAGTFTRGMVSAVNRLVTTQTSYQLSCIQHDAPINNGNSGGALVNAYGQIIGINALKITADGYEGLGFSVPSKTVIRVINTIIETGIAPKTPKLGISYVQAIYYSQFLADLIEENNLPAGSIVIAEITEDSSLYNSELQVNDIVTEVNGEPLTSPDLLVQLIQNSNVGDAFELTVKRIIMNEDGTDYVDIETFTVTATLVEKTDSAADESNDDAQEDFYEYFGDDSGNYEDFYDYFYDYFYGGGNPYGNSDTPEGDNRFSIPGE